MIRRLSSFLLWISLAVCLAFSGVYFLGRIEEGRFKSGFLLASLAYFLFAGLWATTSKRAKKK